MKKRFLSLFFLVLGFSVYAQKGDLFVGGTGAWITKYKAPVYGLNVGYHLSDGLEASFTGFMNPAFKSDFQDLGTKSDVKLYSASLDLRFYLLLQRTWGMGPLIGGQYIYRSVTDPTASGSSVGGTYTDQAAGFNIGWHMRFNLSDYVKLTGGWRYTAAGNELGHNLYYIGLGYTFELK